MDTDKHRLKPHFTNKLSLTPNKDGVTWTLDHAFGYWSARTSVVSVPKDFVTDLASIPKIFWNILPPFGKYTEAAVIHDYVYRTHLFRRAVCDGILLEAMRLCDVPRWQRVVIYLAVRAFGWMAWRDEKRNIPRPKIHLHKP